MILRPEVLFISHNGLTEPLGRRQVLPYLVGLGRRGWRYHALSFEKPQTADKAACESVRSTLESIGARWTPLQYHQSPPILSTAFDMARGLRCALSDHKPLLIHARSTVPAAMASALSWRFGTPWIFDVRGLLAREYADAGHWNPSGPLCRMTDAVEHRLLRRANGLVFLTHRIESELLRTTNATPHEVVPCTTDLEEFQPRPDARRRIRESLGLGKSRVLVYSGSARGWYRMAEMAAFFRVAREEILDLRFLVLSPHVEAATRALNDAGIATHATVLSLRPEQVPDHLAAADAGICFVGDLPSKRASSPTKYGEYLASGLPVVTNPWTGDAAALRGAPGWILVDRLGDDAYRQGARELAELLARPSETIEGARALAEREFSLDRAIVHYDRLYRRVLGGKS